MSPTTGQRAHSADRDSPACRVCAHRSSPDRTVFVEEDNTNAWIATDFAVEFTP